MFFLYVFYYGMSGYEPYIYYPISGLYAIMAAFFLGLKQIGPDRSLLSYQATNNSNTIPLVEPNHDTTHSTTKHLFVATLSRIKFRVTFKIRSFI